MRVVSVVGTRPQLIKAAALQPVLRARHHEVFVDTGQHWDDALAGSFFAELSMARPDHSLGAGGGTNGEQTATMLQGLEPILTTERPDLVIVFGDTNSTLAGALAAAKLDIPVAHVEAGVRSFDRSMPEEINRIVADHLATWLLAPTRTAVDNLRAEGIERGVTLVGDLMRDLAARVAMEVTTPAVLAEIAGRLDVPLSPGSYLFSTMHRHKNRSPAALRAWLAILGAAAAPSRPVILALHPGTRAALDREGLELPPHVRIIEPQGYRTSLALQLHAAAVLTDSGGVQREATWLGTPCLVLRSTSEWPELAQAGDATRLTGLDPVIVQEALADLAPASSSDLARARATGLRLEPDGAAAAIVAAIERRP